MTTRRRMPALCRIENQDCRDASSSSRIVVCICAISARTNSESRSPSAWYLTRMSYASSLRSLVTSHLGLSGRKNTKLIWINDGASCSRDGIRQPQLLGMLLVPKVIPAAAI